jgi:ABC-2 type transport system permease protein
MILTILRIGFINLRRDRVVQALSFLLPIMFFSIFATVFGNQGSVTQKVDVAVVDEDQSDYSKKLVAALAAEGALRVRTTKTDTAVPDAALLDRDAAEKLVKDGTIPVAIILPSGLGTRKLWGGAAAGAPKVQLLADVSDPIAPKMVEGILQEVSFTAAPEALASQGIEMFQKYSGPLTPSQQANVDTWLSSMRGRGAATPAAPDAERPAAAVGLQTEVVNVMQKGTSVSNANMVSFYAAGIGVMFLLFSSAGAGGTLLEEAESGTLGRLLGAQGGMTSVLAGKWVFLTICGVLQLTVMFVWGALAFHLPLAIHLPGFVVMAVVTAAAASAFGLVLATISRSRQQLSGISTIVILAMSAIGGSMFPRFLMTAAMQKFGKITFNAWALDGFQKVFWRGARVVELWPEVTVLVGLTLVFLLAARLFARRWEIL